MFLIIRYKLLPHFGKDKDIILINILENLKEYTK